MPNYLLEEQAAFDPIPFDREGWAYSSWRDEKTGHIQLHVAKAALKLVSNNTHLIVQEAMPDLAIYRSQLMNLFKISEEYIERNFYPKANRVDILSDVVIANGNLAYYLEPLQHGGRRNPHKIKFATVALNNAAHGLAILHNAPLEDAHYNRLDKLRAERRQQELLEQTA